MKQKIGGFIVLCLFLVLVGCDNNSIDTGTEIDYLLSNEAYVYTYQEAISIESIGRVFTSIEDIDLDANFIAIVFDCSKYYNDISSDMLEEIYQLLNSNHHIMVLFVDAVNYNFFEGTSFANEKGHYESEEYVYGLYNFAAVEGVVEISYNLSTDNQDERLTYAVISVYYRRVSTFIGMM